MTRVASSMLHCFSYSLKFIFQGHQSSKQSKYELLRINEGRCPRCLCVLKKCGDCRICWYLRTGVPKIYFATDLRPPDTETGKGLSQIGVDKASNAQVPLNSTGILICLNFLTKVCARSDALKKCLDVELKRRRMPRFIGDVPTQVWWCSIFVD